MLLIKCVLNLLGSCTVSVTCSSKNKVRLGNVCVRVCVCVCVHL